MTNDMKIIAQFIWTISDALGVIGLLIMVLAFGVAWICAKMDTRCRRKGSKRQPNVKGMAPGSAVLDSESTKTADR